MAICVDPSIRALKKLGYNGVRYPKAALQPLVLIGRQRGETAILDTLPGLITNDAGAPPTVDRDQPSSGIHGEKTGKLDASLGLDILGAVIGAMGGNLGVKTAYQDARKIQFEFQDVLTDTVLPGRVGAYLSGGRVDGNNLVFKEYVLGNGELYVVTETLKSRKFSLSAEVKGGGNLAVDLPVIKQILGASLSVEAAAGGSQALVYEGPVALTFAFKCFELGVEDGELRMVSQRPTGRVSFAAAPGGPAAADISEQGPLSFGL
ncbi:MAG TPA: hypothetical protein VG389_29185 [Myxococcota bacterium]|jgi:hypothetical protein|nr:hypothetical protein [Myxococcota bacterium]